jgi:hypothetical protein
MIRKRIDWVLRIVENVSHAAMAVFEGQGDGWRRNSEIASEPNDN